LRIQKNNAKGANRGEKVKKQRLQQKAARRSPDIKEEKLNPPHPIVDTRMVVLHPVLIMTITPPNQL